MKKTAFIWRGSVYKNNFCCNRCGISVAMPSGELLGNTLLVEEHGLILCPNCMNVVAKIKEIDAPEVMNGLQGNWMDFEKEQRN